MRNSEHPLNTNLPDRSKLTAQKKKKKTVRYDVDVWMKFFSFNSEHFWYDLGGSNQLDEANALIQKAVTGAGSGYSFAKLTVESPSMKFRITDNKLKKVQLLNLSLESGQIKTHVLQDWHESK